MKVFKFGGASVKDAAGVQNLLAVLKTTGETELVIVVSAMGKTTRHLEEYIDGMATGEHQKNSIGKIRDYHVEIMQELFDEKKDVFATSQYGLTKGLVELDEWTMATLNKRQKDLATIATSVWRFP
jgi:aspartate kinase